ncbi:MAG: hypothetical protein WC250_03150 [Candidatus Paceibacterota bacterium]|jgi:hypothetical protein
MDDPRHEPTDEQIKAYASLERQLRSDFLGGTTNPGVILKRLEKLKETARGMVNCDIAPRIPSWADQENPIVQHIPGGVVDPSRLATVDVFDGGEVPHNNVRELIARGQKLPGAMNACMFDFYAKWENWKYLPKNVSRIVFPNTIFCSIWGSHGYNSVCYLGYDGLSWCKQNQKLEWGIHSARVAVNTSFLKS